jgi:hypothetical protein
MAILSSLVISGLLMVFYWAKPQSISFTGAAIGQPEWPPTLLKTWKERHLGFEVHATLNDDTQWWWRTFTNLPAIIKQFGGRLHVLVTQPDWAVCDQQGKVYQGGDGVEVRFVIERNGIRETVEHVSLNLHQQPEQRCWQRLEISVPAGSQRLCIETLPGPPGSNNWHDRVWVSVEQAESLVDNIISLAHWLVIGLLVFLALSVPFLLPRVPVASRRYEAIFIIATNALPIAFFFFLCETYLRMNGYQTYRRTYPGQYQNRPVGVAWAESDSLFGWTVFKSDGETNPQGFRDKKDFGAIDLHTGKTRVMILGDSFIYGSGITPDENVPSLLQTKPQGDHEFYNLGVPGWGMDQMYLAYQKYKDVIAPDIVIIAFIDDDVNRVLEAYRVWEGMNKPSFTIKDGELVPRTSPTPSQLLLNRLMGKSVLWGLIIHHVDLIKDAGDIVKHIFLKMAEETKRQNRKFVVVRIPTKDNANFVTNFIYGLNKFGSLLKSNGVQYLEPLDEIRQFPQWTDKFYLKNDGHMSVAGNQFLADYIHRQVFEQTLARSQK